MTASPTPTTPLAAKFNPLSPVDTGNGEPEMYFRLERAALHADGTPWKIQEVADEDDREVLRWVAARERLHFVDDTPCSDCRGSGRCPECSGDGAIAHETGRGAWGVTNYDCESCSADGPDSPTSGECMSCEGRGVERECWA